MSIVGHLVATGLGGLLVASTLGRKPALPLQTPPAAQVQQDDVVEIDLPAMLDGTRAEKPTPAPELPPEALARGGGEGKPALDTGRKGRGGTDTAEAAAANLADRDDGTLLTPEVRNRLDRDQIQRIQASKKRASREDWRASREPMELTFVADGPRERPTRMDRRHGALRDPSSGGHERGAPSRLGGARGAAMLPQGFGESPRLPGGPFEGADRASAGAGIRDGLPGWDHRDAARGARARPMVNEGSPSVPSNAQGRPTDNVDAEQEVASAMQSIIHASTAGGAPGGGTGGQQGPGPAGAGGQSGPGSQSRALGSGHGSGVDQDPRDKRRTEYIRQVLTKLGPHTQSRQLMPPAAALEGAQGVTIVTFTIRADGTVTGASVTRTSGIPELDENCRKAILRAAPFPPLPAELGTTFRWAMPLDMRNPAVRPRAAKVEHPTEG